MKKLTIENLKKRYKVIDEESFNDYVLPYYEYFKNSEYYIDSIVSFEVFRKYALFSWKFGKINFEGFYKDEQLVKTLLIETKDWDEISFSPYSMSIYNSRNIDWGYKPEGSLRISDHWNFESQGEIHCRIENEEKNNHLMMCEYKNGIYNVIKDFTEMKEGI